MPASQRNTSLNATLDGAVKHRGIGMDSTSIHLVLDFVACFNLLAMMSVFELLSF